MKFSLIIACILAFTSFPSGDTVDTYDWTAYESASKKVDEALQKVVEANVILNDNYEVDFDGLPKRTKSQLAILQDAAYLEWLIAEEKLGIDESAKYWKRFDHIEKSPGLTCYQPFEEKLLLLLPKTYENIKTCSLETRTACHLAELKKLVQLDIEFYDCIEKKHGNGKQSLFTFTKDPTIVNH